MGTRSTIKIQGLTYAKVYKHWDGTPEYMLPWLSKFNKAFANERGNDPAYKFAQLLRFTSSHAEKFALDNDPFTGWGVVRYSADMDQEYEYTLMHDGSVKTKEISA